MLSVGEDPILQMDDGCYNNHDGPDGDDLKELGASASSTANELGIMSKGRARPVYRQLSPFEAPAITCVGDDDQAIFSFRGGGGESFGFFAQAFRGVFAAMPLLETYRCTKVCAPSSLNYHSITLSSIFPTLPSPFSYPPPSLSFADLLNTEHSVCGECCD